MSHFPNNQNTFGKHPPTGPPSDEEPPKKPTQDPPADGEDMETPTKPKKRRRNRHKKKATEKETEVSNTNPADPDSDSSSDSQLDEEGGVQLNDLQEETDGRSASHAFVEHDPPVISDDDAADILLQMSRAPPTDIQPVHLLPRPTRARNFDNATSVREQHLIMTSKSAPNIASGCIFTPNNPTPAAEAGLVPLRNWQEPPVVEQGHPLPEQNPDRSPLERDLRNSNTNNGPQLDEDETQDDEEPPQQG